MLVGLGIVTSALAAKTAPQSPSSPPSSVLGLNLSGGFSQQPIDSNVIGGNSVTLSVRAQRSALEAATSLLVVASTFGGNRRMRANLSEDWH